MFSEVDRVCANSARIGRFATARRQRVRKCAELLGFSGSFRGGWAR